MLRDVFMRIPLHGEHIVLAGEGISYIHIGVGSDVVCSTAIGNARASIRGADNSDDSTSFYVLRSGLLTHIKSPI